MVYNDMNFNEDLRELFCNTIIKIFGNTTAFLDYLENEKYSAKYDCYLDGSGENYIINRETGEYINWYKLYHIGRCINISAFCTYKYIPKWVEEFLFEFKDNVDKENRSK